MFLHNTLGKPSSVPWNKYTLAVLEKSTENHLIQSQQARWHVLCKHTHTHTQILSVLYEHLLLNLQHVVIRTWEKQLCFCMNFLRQRRLNAALRRHRRSSGLGDLPYRHLKMTRYTCRAHPAEHIWLLQHDHVTGFHIYLRFSRHLMWVSQNGHERRWKLQRDKLELTAKTCE